MKKAVQISITYLQVNIFKFHVTADKILVRILL